MGSFLRVSGLWSIAGADNYPPRQIILFRRDRRYVGRKIRRDFLCILSAIILERPLRRRVRVKTERAGNFYSSSVTPNYGRPYAFAAVVEDGDAPLLARPCDAVLAGCRGGRCPVERVVRLNLSQETVELRLFSCERLRPCKDIGVPVVNLGGFGGILGRMLAAVNLDDAPAVGSSPVRQPFEVIF